MLVEWRWEYGQRGTTHGRIIFSSLKKVKESVESDVKFINHCEDTKANIAIRKRHDLRCAFRAATIGWRIARTWDATSERGDFTGKWTPQSGFGPPRSKCEAHGNCSKS